uniref:Hypothetical chloroplast RF21 n=1 Tax=Dasya binghamiae TaxID=1896963 RepID=A0A1C8XSA1_9FLOR|nr:hypothetical chloroplast RF21 [Dasya binghamiae]AOH77388.1 hypothetical chloroplast RF21 [Dasya binghamiae]
MAVYIYTFYKFHYMFILPQEKIKYLTKNSCKFIPIEWQLILANEGSFTQILNSLSGKKIHINMLQKNHYTSKNMNKHIRCIWLENSIYTKFIFARSIWIFTYLDTIDNIIQANKPIGNSLINSQVDTYKNIHEIYYGYSKDLEQKFQNHQPLWGRKYTLYYKNKSSVTIQEFFSPYIINFFYI